MPYRWNDTSKHQQLTAWPNRSLSPHGLVIFISVTAAMFLLPLFAVLGTKMLWVFLGIFSFTIALTWHLIERNTKDGAITEVLQLSQKTVTLLRRDTKNAPKDWSANPFWVKVNLHESGGPVANYITLEGGHRAVELGAFLSPEERLEIFHELNARLKRLDINAH